MPERIKAINSFLSKHGWGKAERNLLAADASFRNYDRLKLGNQRAVLMNAPPPMENVRPFILIAKHLEKLGFSTPHIMAEDVEAGFLLLEDFGDNTFTKHLANGGNEEELYQLAIDVLIELHKLPTEQAIPKSLPYYDDDKLLTEVGLLPDWYMPAIFGKPTPKEARDEYIKLWKKLLPVARNVPETMVLRDYHVDNLMTIAGRSGTKSCGLLDFQDGIHGAVTYDVMSLLEDARRDISTEIIAEMRNRYLKAFSDMDIKAFDDSWAVLGAMRHCKVIGIFTRLCVRDKKPVYLEHIPRLWRLLDVSFENPVLSEIKEWIDCYIPENARKIPNV